MNSINTKLLYNLKHVYFMYGKYFLGKKNSIFFFVSDGIVIDVILKDCYRTIYFFISHKRHQ